MKEKIRLLLNSKVAHNSFWMLILQCFNLLLPLITVPYVTRVLGVVSYGIFSSALNWVYYFQVVVEYGFGLWGARKIALIKDDKGDELDELYSIILVARVMLSIISISILIMLSVIMKVSISRFYCQMILYLMVIGNMFQLVWLYQGKENMRPITIINVVSRIISVVLIFIFVNDKDSLYTYCLFYSITFVISGILMIFVAQKEYNIKFKIPQIHTIFCALKDAWYVFFSSALIKVFSGVAVTILGIISTDYYVGIYSALYKIPYILVVSFSAISQAIFPNVSKKYSESKSIGDKYVNKIAVPFMIIFFLGSLVIVIFSDILIKILFGTDYLGYSLVIVFLLAQTLFAILNNFLGVQKLVASGFQKEYSDAFVRSMIVMLVIYFVCLKVSDPNNAIYAVSAASFISEIVVTVNLLFAQRKLRYEQ